MQIYNLEWCTEAKKQNLCLSRNLWCHTWQNHQPICLNSVYPCYLSNHIFLLMWFIAICCSFTKHNCLQYLIKLASLFVTRASHIHCQNSQQKREWETVHWCSIHGSGGKNSVCNGVKQTKPIQHSSIAKHAWRAGEKQRQLSRWITLMEAITSMAWKGIIIAFSQQVFCADFGLELMVETL